jgi:hypothetical protein
VVSPASRTSGNRTKPPPERQKERFQCCSSFPSAPNIALRIQAQKLSGFVVKAKNIFCELFGSGMAEDTFWLDSSTQDQA